MPRTAAKASSAGEEEEEEEEGGYDKIWLLVVAVSCDIRLTKLARKGRINDICALS